MSVQIECKGKTILHIKNVACEMLYECILKIIDKTKISPSEDIQRLIEQFDQAGYGIGFDIADFIKNQIDADIFALLTKEAINLYKNEVPSLPIEVKERLDNFHKELLNYAEELKD